jgi:hypothetical protein
LRPSTDPISRYLDDANALARFGDIPEDVRGPVVADLCRCAIEAACHRNVWRTRLARWVPHARIEEAIDGCTKLTTTAALALFDDPDRGGEVLRRLNNAYGTRTADAYQACQRGVTADTPATCPASSTTPANSPDGSHDDNERRRHPPVPRYGPRHAPR